MLLSRVADSLYWISRYLERAEHTARLIDVAVDLGLGRAQTPGGAVDRLYGSLGLSSADAGAQAASLADVAFFDASNRNSVMSCVNSARENARQVREEISVDMWKQLNELFLRLKQLREDTAWTGRTHHLARSVIEGILLFQGTTDSTMQHGEGWQYLQLGRFLERAGSIAGLLDAFVSSPSEPESMSAPLDQAEWVALLRSCSALEAYCRHYTADVRPERVTEFLLLNADFPRSIRFVAAHIETSLLAIGRWTARGAGGRVERLSGRLHASLDYGQVDEILSEDPHAYLAGITRQCDQIHTALYQTYTSYPIESALPA